MGNYTFIGNLEPRESDGYLEVKRVEVPEAPRFMGGPNGCKINLYRVTLGWIETLVQAFPIFEEWARPYEDPIPVTQEHLAAVRAMKAACTQEYLDGIFRDRPQTPDNFLPTLQWFEWWIEWALRTCPNPAMSTEL